METILEDYKRYNAFNEAYEVVRTVEVVGRNRKTYRIEVLKSYPSSATPFQVRYLTKDEVTVQPTYPQRDGKFEREPESITVWHRSSEPWVVAQTAEDALKQALDFLAKPASYPA
jgi:hypothetical protein